jgi:hypothetical protein
MLSRTFYLLLISACVIMSSAVFAQEGHPLVGTWHGNWGTSAANRSDMTLVMDWDGKVLSGVMNPGFDGLQLQNAKLNPKDWTVHFEVDRKENAGTVRCMVDGKIDKLGSDRRTLTGTYACGATKGDFKLTRDRDY